MYHPNTPDITQWYQDIDKNEMFRVVAENGEEDFIEIQYFSGEIEELDFNTWFSLHLETIPPPEDASGPFELSQEELGYDTESTSPPENGSNPLIELGLYENYLSNNPNYSSFDNYDSYAQHEKYRKYFDKKHFF